MRHFNFKAINQRQQMMNKWWLWWHYLHVAFAEMYLNAKLLSIPCAAAAAACEGECCRPRSCSMVCPPPAPAMGGPRLFTPRPPGPELRALSSSAPKSYIRRFVITEKAPTRAFSWLKAGTTAFTFKTLLRHYAKQTLTPRSLNVKLDPRHKGHKGRAGWLA